jgi:hypothetical protein
MYGPAHRSALLECGVGEGNRQYARLIRPKALEGLLGAGIMYRLPCARAEPWVT